MTIITRKGPDFFMPILSKKIENFDFSKFQFFNITTNIVEVNSLQLIAKNIEIDKIIYDVYHKDNYTIILHDVNYEEESK